MAKNIHDQTPFELISEPDDPKWADIIGDSLKVIIYSTIIYLHMYIKYIFGYSNLLLLYLVC